MSAGDKVYVLEVGVYEHRTIVGVFSTLDGAQGAARGPWQPYTPEGKDEPTSWENPYDFWDAATIWVEVVR